MSAQGDRTSKEFVTGRSLVKKLLGQLNGLLEIMRNPRANIENRRNAAEKLSLTQPFGYPTLVNELINSKSWQSREAAAHGVKHFFAKLKTEIRPGTDSQKIRFAEREKVEKKAVSALEESLSRDEIFYSWKDRSKDNPEAAGEMLASEAAAEALGTFGSKGVNPLERIGLTDARWVVRRASVSALGNVGKEFTDARPEAVSALVKALNDNDYGVREDAVFELKRLAQKTRSPEAFFGLAAALHGATRSSSAAEVAKKELARHAEGRKILGLGKGLKAALQQAHEFEDASKAGYFLLAAAGAMEKKADAGVTQQLNLLFSKAGDAKELRDALQEVHSDFWKHDGAQLLTHHVQEGHDALALLNALKGVHSSFWKHDGAQLLTHHVQEGHDPIALLNTLGNSAVKAKQLKNILGVVERVNDSVKGIREGEREAVYSMLVQSAAKGRITAEQAGERLSGLGRSEVGRAELEERLGLLPKKRVEERMKEGWTRFREKVRRK